MGIELPYGGTAVQRMAAPKTSRDLEVTDQQTRNLGEPQADSEDRTGSV